MLTTPTNPAASPVQSPAEGDALRTAAQRLLTVLDAQLFTNDHCGLQTTKQAAPMVDAAIEALRAALSATQPKGAVAEGDRSLFTGEVVALYDKADIAPNDATLSVFEEGFIAGKLAAASPSPAPAQVQPLPEHADHVGMIAARLRRLARVTGTEKAIPEDDSTAVGAIFTVLGTMASILDRKAASPAVKAEPGFDECVASGQSCSYGPHGRKGEMQCRYCGKEQDKPYGWLFGNSFWEATNQRLPADVPKLGKPLYDHPSHVPVQGSQP